MRAAAAAMILAAAAAGPGLADARGTSAVVEAEITALVDILAAATGETFVVHPEAQGTVRWAAPEPLAELEAERLVAVVVCALDVRDVAVSRAARGAYRITPKHLVSPLDAVMPCAPRDYGAPSPATRDAEDGRGA